VSFSSLISGGIFGDGGSARTVEVFEVTVNLAPPLRMDIVGKMSERLAASSLSTQLNLPALRADVTTPSLTSEIEP